MDRKAIAPDQRWAFDNDISLSALGAEPAGANVVQGRWWPADYAGPPLVALDAQIARVSSLFREPSSM